MTAIDDVFNALFYGSGSFLGILLILLLCVGLVMKWKELSVLVLPIVFLLGMEYAGHGMAYHTLIMFLGGIFLMLYNVKQFRAGR